MAVLLEPFQTCYKNYVKCSEITAGHILEFTIFISVKRFSCFLSQAITTC